MTRVALAMVAGVVAALCACAIGPNDPLPSLGAPCVVSEGHCGIEHVCDPDAAGADTGLCRPVTSYGLACDEPTHPSGRNGEDDIDTLELIIAAPEDIPRLSGVRSFAGQVRIQRADGPVALGTLCGFRDLQRVGNGLGLGKSDVVDFNGLQSLTSVAGGLAVYSNPQLESLAGLEHLVDIVPRTVDSVTFDVIIVGNADLDDDTIAAFRGALEGRLGREPAVVACGNADADCSAAEQDLAQALTSAGLAL